MPKIPALPPMTSVDTADQLPIEDVSTGTTKYITLTKLKEWFQSLAGWITYGMIGTNTLRSTNVDWSTSTGKIWWEELGRTTLGGAGDTISVTGLTARKHLRVYATLLNSGTLLGYIRFNNDSAGNYSYKGSTNYGAAADGTSAGQIAGWLSGADSGFVILDIVNMAATNKSVILQEGGIGGAASAAPFSVELRGKWVNTSAQITRIDFINAGAGDFLAGSEVVVLGHD